MPRDFVHENQRARLVVGTVAAISEHGYHATTITKLAKAASVSRHTFYDNFDNKEEAFLAAYDRAFADLRAAMLAAKESASDGWAAQVEAELRALLDFFAREPELARFFWLEPPGAGEAIADRAREAMRSLLELLGSDRPPGSDEYALSETAREAVIGGVVALVVRQIHAGKVKQLPDLLPDLLELILAPSLGSAEAAKAADRAR